MAIGLSVEIISMAPGDADSRPTERYGQSSPGTEGRAHTLKAASADTPAASSTPAPAAALATDCAFIFRMRRCEEDEREVKGQCRGGEQR